MDNDETQNEEIQGVKFSEFPLQTPESSDEVVGLHSNGNARFNLSSIIYRIRESLVNTFVPLTRSINNKALSSNISLNASDVGARPDTWMPTAAQVGARPDTWVPTAAQVGAVPVEAVGVAGGVPNLDEIGRVPASQLPPYPTVPSASTANPQMDGTPSPGSTGEWADGGHVHPTDTTRAPAGYGLGVKLGTLTPIADANSTDLMTGWYATSASPVDTQNLPAGLSGDDKVGAIYAAVRGEYIYQEFYCNRQNLVYSRLRGWDTALNDYAWTPWRVEASIDPANPYATEQQIAFVETGTTASRTYAVGEYFCWGGLLYRVTAAISSGAAFTPGTNCVAQTVGDALTARAPAGYGLGVMTRDIGVSLTDCNDAAVTGWYDVAAGAANRPSGLSQYYQAVIYSVVRGPIYSYQEYYDFNTGKVYRRFKNTTWSSWVQI